MPDAIQFEKIEMNGLTRYKFVTPTHTIGDATIEGCIIHEFNIYTVDHGFGTQIYPLFEADAFINCPVIQLRATSPEAARFWKKMGYTTPENIRDWDFDLDNLSMIKKR